MGRSGLERRGGTDFRVCSNIIDDFSWKVEYNRNTIPNDKGRSIPLRKLNDAIDRFCALHPNLAIPGLMRYIVGANVILYVLSLFAGGGTLNFLALDISRVLHGEIWRLITYVLLPTSGGIGLIITSMFYYWIGETLERMWGSAKFTFYYVSGTLLTALGLLAAYLIDGVHTSLWGAYYVNMAMFFAYATLYPDLQVLAAFLIPIRIKWLALLDAALFVYEILSYLSYGRFAMALLPIIAIFNYFIFFWEDLMEAAGKGATRVRHQRSAQTINFKKAQKDLRERRGYLHKCAVCGVTDQDDPNMEFRYCSKCTGYYCYCANHINNHTHVV